MVEVKFIKIYSKTVNYAVEIYDDNDFEHNNPLLLSLYPNKTQVTHDTVEVPLSTDNSIDQIYEFTQDNFKPQFAPNEDGNNHLISSFALNEKKEAIIDFGKLKTKFSDGTEIPGFIVKVPDNTGGTINKQLSFSTYEQEGDHPAYIYNNPEGSDARSFNIKGGNNGNLIFNLDLNLSKTLDLKTCMIKSDAEELY